MAATRPSLLIPQWCQEEPQESLKPISRKRYATDQAAAHVWCASPDMHRLISIVGPRCGHGLKYFAFGDYDGPDTWWPREELTDAQQLLLDADWRKPGDPQLYTDRRLHIWVQPNWWVARQLPFVLLGADVVKPLTHEEKSFGFSLMTWLAGKHMVNLESMTSLWDETTTGRAYQTAMIVLVEYYQEKRSKADPALLAAARIVLESVHLKLGLRTLHQWMREFSGLLANERKLRALKKGAWLRLSAGTLSTVPPILAGLTYDAVAGLFGLARSTVRDSVNSAMSGLHKEFDCYCYDAIPAEVEVRAWYNGSERKTYYRDERSKQIGKPQVASAARLALPRVDARWSVYTLDWGDVVFYNSRPDLPKVTSNPLPTPSLIRQRLRRNPS